MKIREVNETQIKLSRNKDQVNAFMKDFWKESKEHPLSRNTRLFGMVGVNLRPFGNQIHISDIINYGETKAGYATSVVKFLTSLADKHGVELEGIAKPYSNNPNHIQDANTLAKWYKSLGFQILGGDKHEGYDILYKPKQNESLNESMNFYAGTQKDDKVWSPLVGDQEKYDWSGIPWDSDEEPKINPNYDPELDLHLSNANAGDVAEELGYNVQDWASPLHADIDEFIARAQQWLQKHVGQRTGEEPTTVSKNPGKATIYHVGKPEGYYNNVIYRMLRIAKIGKEKGATHVWLI